MESYFYAEIYREFPLIKFDFVEKYIVQTSYDFAASSSIIHPSRSSLHERKQFGISIVRESTHCAASV